MKYIIDLMISSFLIYYTTESVTFTLMMTSMLSVSFYILYHVKKLRDELKEKGFFDDDNQYL